MKKAPILFAYLLAALLLYIVALPYLIYLSFKQKYKNSIPARFFLQNNPPLPAAGTWFHACSLGEVKSLAPILKLCTDARITTTTETGFSEAKKLSSESRFLPFEIFMPFWVRPQKRLVVVEAELWPALFAFAKLRGAKTALINARITDSSYHKYLRLKRLYAFLFSFIDIVYAQSEEDAKRLTKLGARNVIPLCNIKLLQEIKTTKSYEKPNATLLCAASTHEGEEQMVLNSFGTLKNEGTQNIKLAIVPRHPERFAEAQSMIEAFCTQKSLSFALFSEDSSFSADITLVNTMGDLINIYAISDVVVLGGSFLPYGGHNPLEPAAFGCKIVSGTGIFNLRPLFELTKNVIFADKDSLSLAIKQAINGPKCEVSGALKKDELLSRLLEFLQD